MKATFLFELYPQKLCNESDFKACETQKSGVYSS